MIISHKHKFIYFKVEKVASTSTELLLSNFCGEDDIVTDLDAEGHKHTPRNHTEIENHASSNQIRNLFGENIFKEYFVFMNVRNPFDRVVSFFHFLKYKGNARSANFSREFRKSIRVPSYSKYCMLGGEYILDDYIKLESLNDDITRIFKKLNLAVDNITIPRAKSKINPHKKHYMDYYSEYQKQVVVEKFKDDFKRFNYEY